MAASNDRENIFQFCTFFLYLYKFLQHEKDPIIDLVASAFDDIRNTDVGKRLQEGGGTVYGIQKQGF